MIVAIDGIVGEFKPINGGLTAFIDEEKRRMIVEFGGHPVEAGVSYYTVAENGVDAKIDAKTGEFTLKGDGMAKFRAICGKIAFDRVVSSSQRGL